MAAEELISDQAAGAGVVKPPGDGVVEPVPEGPSELLERATAAHLAGDFDRAIPMLQRAFRGFLDEGSRHEALGVAFILAMILGTTGQPSLFNGWVIRAERLLGELQQERADGDPVGLGYVKILEMHRGISAGDFAQVHALAGEVTALGRRFHESDLVAFGLVAEGRHAIYSGDVPRGLDLLDEAIASVLCGECSGLTSGMVLCAAIEGCQEIGAIDRLCEWTAALNTWCRDKPGLKIFHGECSLHRGQVLSLHGAWAEAVEEFEASRPRFLERGLLASAGWAERQRGDLLRLRGDDEGAERAYQAAAEYGSDPQPGLALLWTSRGQSGAATAAIHRCLAETLLPAQRVALLPAAIEVLLAVGAVDEVAGLVRELDALAAMTGCAPVRAAAAQVHALSELAGHDPGAALPYARKAVHDWSSIGCPFEAARSRVLMARSLAELGDRDSSRAELVAARASFTALGAQPCLAEVEGLLSDRPSGAGPDGLTAREVEVIGLVAAGHSNRQIAGELFLSEKTVARHLSNIFTKLGVTSRTAAAAYAFEHDLT